MAISISISISQGAQSIPNNTTTVTASVVARWTYGSWNGYNQPGYLIIDGTRYDFTSKFNTGRSTSGSQTLYTASKTVAHASDGTKTVSCTASYTSGVSSGTVSASNSLPLSAIPRKSTLAVANGTLGTAQTLTITELSSGFNHKLTYACGNTSGYILGSSSATSSTLSQSWTPPISLAAQNTTGTSLSITFTLYTYSGSTHIGSNTYTKSFAIPASVKPTCSLAVSDPTGYATTYGGYLKGLSKIKVVVTATPNQGSPIASYSTTANGSTYTTSSFTTSEVKSTGTLSIASTVTDKRGRSGTASKNITALDYNEPSITELKVKRCNSNGAENNQGAYLQITFSSSVTALSNKNTATYKLEYKKSSVTAYTAVTLTAFANNYAVTNGTHVFAAATDSSYDIRLTVTDKFKNDFANTKASTAFTLMHWLKSGLGMAIGKIAELENYFDVGFAARFRKSATFDNTTTFTGAATFNGTAKIKNVDFTITDAEYDELLKLVGGGVILRLVDWFYPVGSIIANVSAAFDPNKIYKSQTWVRFAKGQTLVGVNESDTTFATAEKTGGEKTHKLTVNEMPSHRHSSSYMTNWDGKTSAGYLVTSSNSGSSNQSTNSTGGGAAHNNLQPYTTVFYWKRTA